ncbi:MAG: molybdopterin-dependent oxidoreductase [Bacteroidetes bacterium]|nr:molybdopterin-dependent oxidoreductase [Bacteroidota bacterium]
MDIKRRDFLKTIGLAGVGVMVLNPVLEAFALVGKKTKNPGALAGGTWIPSTCHGCTSWCPNEVYQQTTGAIKRAVKVRGNQISVCNTGMLCPKGHMAPQEGYDPDRLKVPMMRTNPTKGVGVDPQWTPITWSAAITALATQMMTLRNAGTPEKFLFMRGRYTPYNSDVIKTALPKIYGSPNQYTHSTLCAEAEKFGPYFTEGVWGYRDYDMEKTKFLLLWGVDPFRSNRQPPRAMQRWDYLRNNATVVVVDPCLIGSAASAIKAKSPTNNNKWAPIIPGTDGALASAIAHRILVQGKWYKPFVGDFNGSGASSFVANTTAVESDFTEIYTYGLVKWWNAELKDKTPAWAAPITGISQTDIEAIADEMGNKAPNVISWQGPGPTMTPRGAYTSMAIQALNGLLGSTRNIGGPMVQPSKSAASLPAYSTFQDATATTGLSKAYIDKRGALLSQPFIDKTIGAANSMQAAVDNILAADPYDIKAALIYYNNTFHSATGAKRWEDAFTTGVPNMVPWMAHITTHASEASQFADILLPAVFSTERWGVLTSSANRFTEMTLMQPVATRLFDVKDEETEIPWLLSLELQAQGFANLYNYYSTKFIDPETGALPTDEATFAEIVSKFFAYPSYNAQGDTWATWKLKGVSSSTQSQYMYQWGNMGTKTKKFEFYSETLKKELNKHAADSYQKVMTVTLTGTSGTADITIAGTPYTATFASNLTTTAANFKTANAAALLAAGITVTSSAATIVLTGVAYGVDFTATAPVNTSGDLAGTIATTVAINASPKWTGKTVDDVMTACNYTAQGELAYVPHYEPPYRIGSLALFPFTFIDSKSRFNREGRSQNNPLYYQFKKLDPGDNNWGDCIKINPIDAAALNVVDGDRVLITSAVNSVGVKVTVKLYEGVRQGTVAKTYGQGHWAYGRFASDFATLTPKFGAGSNNQFMPAEWERLSGANVRNGGYCGVQLVKV